MATIFITGGSGFIGRNLIRALRSRGDDVRALARSDAAIARVTALGATPVRGGLDDAPALRDGMRGCDVVIHAAAQVTEWGPREQYHHDNVTGTANVVAAAREAGVSRLVHLSTEAALADGTPMVRIDESRPLPRHPYARYCASKAAAEALVLAANGGDASLATIVVRPRMVWGADDTSMLPLLIEAVQEGRFMWIGGGRHLTSTCHVANVVDGVLRAMDSGRGGEAYILTDGEPLVLRDFMTRMLATQGVHPGNKSVPFAVARATAWVTETLWDRLSLRGKPPITRMVVCLFGQEVTLVDAKARRELGYVGPKSIEAGLEELKGRPQADA
jgi:nucleoside-diphosphate-sugar epimerase